MRKIVTIGVILLVVALGLVVYFIFFRIPCCEQPPILDMVDALSRIDSFQKEPIEGILRAKLTKDEGRSNESFTFYVGTTSNFQRIELRESVGNLSDAVAILDLTVLQNIETRAPLTLGNVIERYGNDFYYFPSRLDAPTSIYCYMYSMEKDAETKFCFTQKDEATPRELLLVREIIIERSR